MTQTAKGYSDNRWATYKQIKDMGGQVRKGEKATHVLFYKFDDEREKPQPGAPDTPATSPEGKAEKAHTRPPMVRCYAVLALTPLYVKTVVHAAKSAAWRAR